MAKINPYLNFDGNCEEAFNLYRKAFGTEFSELKRASDAQIPVSEEEKNRILHIRLPIGDSQIMGSDIFKSFGGNLVIGNNNHISISADSKEEADRIYTILSEDGEIEIPLEQQFFGYFGSFTDRFGVKWMIVFEG